MCSKALIRLIIFVLIFSTVVRASNDEDTSDVIKTHKAKACPVIDGVLEDVWQEADSANRFIQLRPNEGKLLSEPTSVYVLQDEEGIYFAFRCQTKNRMPDCELSSRDNSCGDYVYVYLDTFKDKRSAYFFGVTAAGVQSDGVISDEAIFDWSWDAVFYSGVKVNQDGYSVEMKIPWRSLRYRKNLSEWGVNFERDIPSNGEEGYFAPFKLDQGFKVSKFKILSGVNPKNPDIGIEFYPRGLARYDKSYGEKETKWRLAADLNWSAKPWLRLQATLFPDFAQIESDPYALNLSKYALFFEEKRPFFVEGAEYFKPPGGASALDLFYSRQIGKRLSDGSEVPFDFGAKLTGRTKKIEVGILGARTGKKKYQGFFGPEEEKGAYFLVNRLKLQVFKNSTLGFLYAGKHSRGLHNQVYSLDGSLRFSDESLWEFQLANTPNKGEKDFAWSSRVGWYPRNFTLSVNGEVIDESFDVSEIGFVPWAGNRSFDVSLGPRFFPEKGKFYYLSFNLGGAFTRERNEKKWSKTVNFSSQGLTRNNWMITLTVSSGSIYERVIFTDSSFTYDPKSVYLYVSSDSQRPFYFSLSVSTSCSYNYYRLYFARSGYVNTYLNFEPSKRVSIFFSTTNWIEWDPQKRLEDITSRFRPGIWWGITKQMKLSIYVESVRTKNIGFFSHRIGISYAYNFLPKSWIYLAFNELKNRREEKFVSLERILAFKIKYLYLW